MGVNWAGDCEMTKPVHTVKVDDFIGKYGDGGQWKVHKPQI